MKKDCKSLLFVNYKLFPYQRNEVNLLHTFGKELINSNTGQAKNTGGVILIFLISLLVSDLQKTSRSFLSRCSSVLCVGVHMWPHGQA